MKIAIVGAGASGLMCSISAAHKAKEAGKAVQITVFESKDRVGKKILATGNGRCNMLNISPDPFYFSKQSFHSYAISKFSAKDHLGFFSDLGLYTRTDEEGRVYPLSNQAATVLDCLRNECSRLGIVFKTETAITKIEKNGKGYILNSDMAFDKVVLACGGSACVKSCNGYDLLGQIGHKVTAIKPSLSKLNTKNNDDVKQLQGIRHKTKLALKDGGKFVCEERGEIFFAKYGISGIAVMQLSAFITRKRGDWVVEADFIPDMSFNFVVDAISRMKKRNPSDKCDSLLMGFMPKKLGEIVVKSIGINCNKLLSELTSDEIKSIVSKAKKYPFCIESVRSFEDAQVTAGGADTAYFNPKTMESLIHKGLYCIGELLDVDGLCGGYNLMWAWSSGRLCGENLIK